MLKSLRRTIRPNEKRLTGALSFIFAVFFSASVSAAPQVGDSAPDFTLQGSDGQTHHLKDFSGSGVVIAFFPKAFTGG